MSPIKSQTLVELRSLKMCRLGTALGSTARVRASSPKAMEIQECAGVTRRLLLAWSDPSRWHTIVEGNFKFKEAIHMRAALMGLRRAVAGTAGHGHRFLSFTDNMSSLLFFDRVRSCSYDLLCLYRRAAALCIGADVSWIFRHLETWRNPSDEGSRRLPGFGRARFVQSSLQPLAPQHFSGALAVQVRVNPESEDPMRHVPTHSRHARAVLELSHGVSWLSAPLRRRGPHVVHSCDLNTTLLVPMWTSAVLVSFL